MMALLQASFRKLRAVGPRPMSKPPRTPWRATALTLFPDAFPGVLGTSIIGGAEKSGIWQLDTVDIRDFSGTAASTVRLRVAVPAWC